MRFAAQLLLLSVGFGTYCVPPFTPSEANPCVSRNLPCVRLADDRMCSLRGKSRVQKWCVGSDDKEDSYIFKFVDFWPCSISVSHCRASAWEFVKSWLLFDCIQSPTVNAFFPFCSDSAVHLNMEFFIAAINAALRTITENMFTYGLK